MEVLTLTLMFMANTQNFDLPKGLISALCYVESHHVVTAIHKDDGGSNSAGVCQIKLDTAKLMGFKGTEKELMKPEINVRYASKYLKKQLVRYKGDIRKAVAAYNAGSYKENIHGQPINSSYVKKVFTAWAEKR